MMMDDGMTASGKGRRALRRFLVMDRGKNTAGNEGATRLQGLLGVEPSGKIAGKWRSCIDY